MRKNFYQQFYLLYRDKYSFMPGKIPTGAGKIKAKQIDNQATITLTDSVLGKVRKELLLCFNELATCC